MTNRRRLYNVANSSCNSTATCANYLLVNWCTDNINKSCISGGNGYNTSNSECIYYQSYGDSCVSSYMAFGFGLIVFLLLPFCYLGVYTMGDVTTPLRVPTRILPVRKEY